MMAELVRALVGAKEETIRSFDRSEVVVSVKNVSKKFCKTLKRSMAYGIADLSKNLMGIRPNSKGLRKDEFWAVKDVSFELKRGEVLGLIGVNGSGKTTLLRLLSGIFPPDKGEISIKGRVGALIAVGAGFHPYMTGRENIYLNGAILGMNREEINSKFQEIVDFAEIGNFLDAPVSTYSSGMRVRLGFSIATAIKPDILLIDEILAVGDVGFRAKCFNVIDRISKKAAVIFVSHNMPQVLRICSDMMVMDRGRAVYLGKDVTKGLDIYYSRFQNTRNSITGSGKATIHDVKIYSGNSTHSSDGTVTLRYADTFSLEISFSLSSDVENAIMNIAFYTREMLGAAQCYSNRDHFQIHNSGGQMRIRVNFSKLYLNPGLYYLSVVIGDDRRGETLVNHHALMQIQVVGSFMGFAPFQLSGEWTYL